jgi:hypothetical protein
MALKGEKTLKSAEQSFVVMPTPREISTSCGLALKIRREDLERVCQELRHAEVDWAGIYRIVKTDSGKKVTELEASF